MRVLAHIPPDMSIEAFGEGRSRSAVDNESANLFPQSALAQDELIDAGLRDAQAMVKRAVQGERC
jgi:hypothetical protein